MNNGEQESQVEAKNSMIYRAYQLLSWEICHKLLIRLDLVFKLGLPKFCFIDSKAKLMFD